MPRPKLWQEFTSDRSSVLCGLCGNSGMIDTRPTAKGPTGLKCGIYRPCICPNGRATKRAIRAEEKRMAKVKFTV
jgi:hypothetical protein